MISLAGSVSVMGIALGIASLIVVLSIMNGFDSEIREKIIGTYAHTIVYAEGGISDSEELAAQLEAIPEVLNAAGFVTGQAILKNGASVTGVLLKGIDPEKESEVTQVIQYIGGEKDGLNDETIIMGGELLKSENLLVGDTIEIMIPYSKLDMQKIKLKIVGTFNSGRYDYDSNIAIISLNTAHKIFRTKGAVTGIGLRVKDEMNADAVKKKLQSMLKYPYIVRSWMDLDKNLVAALAMEKKMMFIVLTLIIMIACFNIAGSLIMLVMEKTKDVGILKALGANSRGISLIFLFEGMIIGVMGVLLGGSLGILVAKKINIISNFIEQITGFTLFPSDVYYFTEIPVEINVPDIVWIITVASTLIFISAVYPARKAAKMDPVVAIRYE